MMLRGAGKHDQTLPKQLQGYKSMQLNSEAMNTESDVDLACFLKGQVLAEFLGQWGWA